MAADTELNPTVWAVNRALGGRLVPLPKARELLVSDMANDVGAISFDYPVGAPGWELLARDVTEDSDLEVEVWLEGRRASRMVGYLADRSRDRVAAGSVAKLTGQLVTIRLDQAYVAPQPADEKKEYRAVAATPGGILAQLVAQAKARGALSDITVGFTSTADANGQPWPEVLTAKWSPGVSLLAVCKRLAELGYIEFTITPDKVFKVWRPGGRGINRTVGGSPVTLRRGENLVDAGSRQTVAGAGTAFLVGGGEGNYTTVADANALARRGRRVEVYGTVGNVDQPDALTAAAQRVAASSTRGANEGSYGLAVGPGMPRPGLGVGVGDLVRVDTDGVLASERLAQWELTHDDAGLAASAQTGSLLRGREAALLKRLTDAQNGDIVSGTSTATDPNQTDTGVPLAPQGVVVNSAAFQEGDHTYSSVTASWQLVQSNEDGSAATDIDGYRVEYALESAPTKWNFGADVQGDDHDGAFTMEPGVPLRVRVAARDRSGHWSQWSVEVVHVTEDDATPPPVTSALVGSDYLGTGRWMWDGKTSAGADMLDAVGDFEVAELWTGTSGNFADATQTGQMFAAGVYSVTDLPYGVTQYGWLVARDNRGNRSGPSARAQLTPGRLVTDDMLDGAVGSAKLADLAVINAKLANLAVNDAKVMTLSVGKLTGGTASFDMLLAGIIRTATSGARCEFDNAGIRLYDSSGALRVQLAAATGNALITGEYRTAMSGSRIVLNPLGSAAAESRWYPTDGVRYSRIKPTTSIADGFEGQGGIIMKAYSALGSQLSGEVGAFPGFASIAYGNEMGQGDVESRVSATSGNVFAGGPKLDFSFAPGGQAFIGCSENNAYYPRHLLRIANKSGQADGNVAVGCYDRHSYIQFDTSIVSVVNDTVLINIQANTFVPGSDPRTKTDIEPAPWTALDTIRAANWYRYRKIGDLSPGQGNPRQLGLMVDELPDELRVHNPDEDWWGVDMYGALAVSWGATREVDARVERLERELAALRALLDRPTLEAVA